MVFQRKQLSLQPPRSNAEPLLPTTDNDDADNRSHDLKRSLRLERRLGVAGVVAVLLLTFDGRHQLLQLPRSVSIVCHVIAAVAAIIGIVLCWKLQVHYWRDTFRGLEREHFQELQDREGADQVKLERQQAQMEQFFSGR